MQIDEDHKKLFDGENSTGQPCFLAESIRRRENLNEIARDSDIQ